LFAREFFSADLKLNRESVMSLLVLSTRKKQLMRRLIVFSLLSHLAFADPVLSTPIEDHFASELNDVQTSISSSLRDMPNVICTKVIHSRWESGAVTKEVEPSARVSVRYSDGLESWGAVSIGKKNLARLRANRDTWVYGEMGPLLQLVVAGIESHEFKYRRSELLREKDLRVFGRTTVGSWQLSLDTVHLPRYEQEIFVDPKTNQIVRIVNTADNQFELAGISKVRWVVDYATSPLREKAYLLPARSEIRFIHDGWTLVVACEFKDFAAFGSDSRLTFDLASTN
jgi:hypothetical protein